MFSIHAAAGIKHNAVSTAAPVVKENDAIKRLDEISREIAEARKTHADTQALYTERQQLMDYVWS